MVRRNQTSFTLSPGRVLPPITPYLPPAPWGPFPLRSHDLCFICPFDASLKPGKLYSVFLVPVATLPPSALVLALCVSPGSRSLLLTRTNVTSQWCQAPGHSDFPPLHPAPGLPTLIIIAMPHPVCAKHLPRGPKAR